MDDIIARIKHKLAYLQQHDDGDLIKYEESGEAVSRYIVYRTHSEDEITAFEAEHSIRLPEDYRRFIMEIGTKGFSIGWAMYSPLEKKNYFNLCLDTPFDFTKTMTYKDTDQFRTEHGYWGQCGCLPIVYDGCTCWYSLIVTGEARGQIWYEDDMSFYAPILLVDGQLFHHDSSMGDNVETPANAQRVTFTQWYEAWLNKQISIAQEHWRKRGRDVPPLALDNN